MCPSALTFKSFTVPGLLLYQVLFGSCVPNSRCKGVEGSPPLIRITKTGPEAPGWKVFTRYSSSSSSVVYYLPKKYDAVLLQIASSVPFLSFALSRLPARPPPCFLSPPFPPLPSQPLPLLCSWSPVLAPLFQYALFY